MAAVRESVWDFFDNNKVSQPMITQDVWEQLSVKGQSHDHDDDVPELLDTTVVERSQNSTSIDTEPISKEWDVVRAPVEADDESVEISIQTRTGEKLTLDIPPTHEKPPQSPSTKPPGKYNNWTAENPAVKLPLYDDEEVDEELCQNHLLRRSESSSSSHSSTSSSSESSASTPKNRRPSSKSLKPDDDEEDTSSWSGLSTSTEDEEEDLDRVTPLPSPAVQDTPHETEDAERLRSLMASILEETSSERKPARRNPRPSSRGSSIATTSTTKSRPLSGSSTSSCRSVASSRSSTSSVASSSSRSGSSARWNMSFSNQRVKEIEKENQRLLGRILSVNSKSTPDLYSPKPPTLMAKSRDRKPTTFSINRKKEQERIQKENEILYDKLIRAKSSDMVNRKKLFNDRVGWGASSRPVTSCSSRQASLRPRRIGERIPWNDDVHNAEWRRAKKKVSPQPANHRKPLRSQSFDHDLAFDFLDLNFDSNSLSSKTTPSGGRARIPSGRGESSLKRHARVSSWHDQDYEDSFGGGGDGDNTDEDVEALQTMFKSMPWLTEEADHPPISTIKIPTDSGCSDKKSVSFLEEVVRYF